MEHYKNLRDFREISVADQYSRESQMADADRLVKINYYRGLIDATAYLM